MWKQILFVLLSLELGLFLLLLPWSGMWEHNLIFWLVPGLRPFLLSDYVRGALNGLGLVNLWIGLSDAWRLRLGRAPLETKQARAKGTAPLDAEAAVVPPSCSRGQ